MSYGQSTSLRVDAIRSKTTLYRRKLYRRTVHFLAAACSVLFFGLVGMFMSADSLSVAVVYGECSSVMLNGSAGIYVVIGIAAFLVGTVSVVATVKIRKNKNRLFTTGGQK